MGDALHMAMKKPQRLEPRWGVSFEMNWSSNVISIAAISLRACELAHTPPAGTGYLIPI
jgi:hypothetical protein